MKINKYIVLSLVLMGAISGCQKDLLNINPLDKINPEAFFTNAKEAEIALNGVYSANDDIWLSFDAMSDDLYDQYPWEGPTEIGRGIHGSTTGYITWKWQGNYKGIARANLFIENIGKASFDETVKKRLLGEAKFLRAGWYADLVDFYQDVPLVLAPLKLADANVAKSSKADVLTAIYKDLDDAIATLPASYSGGDVGRITKGAALTLKARVLLYNSKWSEAAAAAKQVMNLNVYALYPDYEGLFTVAAENNSEVIFDSQYIKNKRQNGYSTVIRDWRSFVPLVNLTDDYYMANGLPITDPTSGYSLTKRFDNRDPRMNNTLGLPGKIYDGETYIPNNDVNSQTGMTLKKWVEWDNTEYWNSEINIILLRYADVLLMYAEAMNEASGPSAEVYNAINAVRKRAGMPDVTSGLSKEALRNEIRHERRVEFVAEGTRYSDIRRWKIAEKVMTNGLGYNRSKLVDPTKPEKWVFEVVVADQRSFDPSKHYVWPIPQVEIDTNPKLEQHSFWK